MYSITNYDYECTKKCKSLDHAQKIISALTKRSTSNEKLAKYISKMCRNFAEIIDEKGRSALHMAASVGNRYEIVEYLLKQGAAINLKDRESGQTSLTRAILYGNVAEAVLLSKNGALFLPDNDFINPLQYCYRVKKPIDNENRCETFVWGKNKNYNIGIGNVLEKASPEYLDAFRKSKIYIQKVAMSSYHTLFLTDDGELFVSGHGKGGRLGSGDELTLVSPKKVTIPYKEEDETLISISAGKNHSLVLTNKNRVYSTGSNMYGQLGNKSCSELLSFTEVVVNLNDAKRVIANDFSSIIATSTSIYAFGTNIGQFGLKKEIDKLCTPRKLNTSIDRTPLDIVESTNSALILYSSTSILLHLFYKYDVKIYKKPLLERIVQISANGGIITNKNCPRQDKPLRFIVLTEFHNVFIWYESTEKFVKCSFTACRFLEIDKIVWSNDEILLLYLGNLYKGTATHELKHKIINVPGEYQETYIKKEISLDLKTKIDLKRIPLIDKIVDFCSDPEGENFIALVENPKKYFSLPELIEKTYDYTDLYTNVNENDSIHDLCFQLRTCCYPVHRIIICHRSEYLKGIIEKNKGEKIILLQELSDLGLPCEIFELILRYIYTNQPIMKTEIERVTVDYHQTLTMLKKVLSVMGHNELIIALKKNSQKCKTPFMPIVRTNFAEFYDVTLKLDCGQELQAHKCILMSLDYFKMMFDNRWAEQDSVNLQSISIEYMQPIIDFLYNNAIEEVRNTPYTENYMYNMLTICDQFFVTDLKNIFELLTSEKISVKNCGEILEFADSFNCEILKNCCMQFISLNFSRILELRSLEATEPKVLQQVNKFYREFFNLDSYWTITPYENAVSDEDLEKFIIDFSVNLKGLQFEDGVKQKQKNKTLKPSKAVLVKLNYEKGGIIAIQENSKQIEKESKKYRDLKQEEFLAEMSQLTEKFDSEAKTWTKVNDKKESKKRQQINVLAAIKANEVLQVESETENVFINLKATPPKNKDFPVSTRLELTSELASSKSVDSPVIDNSQRTKLTFSIADITPFKIKSSQKNRKRLSSGSVDGVHRNIFNIENSAVVSPQTPTNPWKNIVVTDVQKSQIESDPLPSTSKPKTIVSPSQTPKSFQSIIENEQKKKIYYEKIKTKSLALTQLEEKAIEELQKFYNVENIFDETISIERYHIRCDDDQLRRANWYQDKK